MDQQTNQPQPQTTVPEPAKQADVQVTPDPIAIVDPTRPAEDNDPLMVAFRAAEAEANAEEAARAAAPLVAQVTPPAGNQPQTVPGGQNQPAAPQTAPATVDPNSAAPAADASVMIPKPRFDEVLREKDQWKERATYLQGVANAQTEMIGKGIAAPGNAPGTPAAPVVPIDQQIAQLEAEKLATADKYEAGEINARQKAEQDIAIDQKVRSLHDQQTEAKINGAAATTQAMTSRTLMDTQVNTQANILKAQNPMVAAIDQSPNAKNIWGMIDGEAMNTLTARGINPLDGTLASRVALMQEKVALANKYGPTLTGAAAPAAPSTPQPQVQPAANGLADARLQKLNLAQTQPPETGGLGTAGVSQPAVTEEKLASMSQDEIADMWDRMPGAMKVLSGQQR